MIWCGDKPEPAFSEPWHAQVFAITVALKAAGHIECSASSERFGAPFKANGLAKELDGGADYFNAWLETLEEFLAETGIAGTGALQQLQTAWTEAYLSTPHGPPVNLAKPG